LWGDAIGSPSSSSSTKQEDTETNADTPVAKRAKRNTSKPSSVPAIEVAQPGASYHPAPEDHQELLAQAIAFRLRQQDAEKKNQRAMRRGAVLRMTADGIGGDAPEVNTDDLSDDDESNGKEKPQRDEDAMDEDAEPEHVNQPWTGKKTKQERNKQLRRKAHELKVIASKQKKQFKQQLEQLPEIIKEIEDHEAETKQRQQIKDIKMNSEPSDVKPKKLGPYKYEEPEPDYLLSEQLPESLRTLNNANKFSLLRDRFQSLQKRNIIEPRVKQRRVYRYHKKRVEKFSTRDPQEQQEQQQQQQTQPQRKKR
jgi:nucleolar protein 53